MLQYMQILISQAQKSAFAIGRMSGTLTEIKQNQLTAIEQQALCHEVMERLRQEQDDQCRGLLTQMEKAGESSALDVLSGFIGTTDSLFSIADSVLKPFLPKLLLTPAFAKLPAVILTVLKLWAG